MPRDTMIAFLHPSEVSTSFHLSIQELVMADLVSPDGVIASDVHSECAPGGIPEGRNHAVERLLLSPLEWLFFVDADMGFAPNALAELRRAADAVERPIVGGLCFSWKKGDADGFGGFLCDPKPTIYDRRVCEDGFERFIARSSYPIAHVVRADATGAACLLIHRSVFQRMTAEFGRTWFDRTLESDGQQLGEDLAFFDRCRRLGIPLHVNTAVRTTHAKTAWVSEWDFWRSMDAPPATEPVDVIVPVLHRPQNVKRFMESLRASSGLARATFVVDFEDDGEAAEVAKYGGRVVFWSGSFSEKVNYAYRILDSTAPWVFLVGDDVVFHAGWLDHAEAVGNQYGAAVVGSNDLGNRNVIDGTHATHMLIHREYIESVGSTFHDGPGVVCGPYRHCFVDNEIVLAAMSRNVWQMAYGSLVEHRHPLWGKGEEDEIYELGQSFKKDDEALFRERADRFFEEAA